VPATLKPGGRVLDIGSKVRRCPRSNYDLFDHHWPLTEKAVAEALELTVFAVEAVRPSTLPLTLRCRLPGWHRLVRLCLK
jgi:hypothetical protein